MVISSIQTTEDLRLAVKASVNGSSTISMEAMQKAVCDFLDLTGAIKESMDVVSEELQCAVCLDVPLDACLTKCQHVFCKHCLDMCRLDKTNCPLCRAALPEFRQKRLFKVDKIIDAVMQKQDSQHKQWKEQQQLERTCKFNSESCKKNLRKGLDTVAGWMKVLEPLSDSYVERVREELHGLEKEHRALLDEFPCSTTNMETLNKKTQDLGRSLDYCIRVKVRCVDNLADRLSQPEARYLLRSMR